MSASGGSAKRWPPFDQKQVEKAFYVGLKFGAQFEQLERDFGVADIGWRILRMQLMDHFKLSIAQVEALRNDPTGIADALAYLSATAKMENERASKGKR
jgi:hypothetical protein